MTRRFRSAPPLEGGALDDVVRVGKAARISGAASAAAALFRCRSRHARPGALPLAGPAMGAPHADCASRPRSSSDAHYVRGLADKAFAAGFNAVRLNQRNCGATEHLSDGLYHSGLTGDPIAVMRELIEVDGLPAFAIAGYSLGGNLALKLAGDYGANPPRSSRRLRRLADDGARGLRGCARRKAERALSVALRPKPEAAHAAQGAAFPGKWSLDALSRIKSIRAFDDAYTAPYHGFRDAADYYHRASAMRVIDKIGIPTLIITAADDPFVPPGPFREPGRREPHIKVMLPAHGGHCGFVEEPSAGYDGYWAEREIVAS